MKNYGFIRAAASTAANRAGDIRFNTSVAKTVIDEAHEKGVSILVFPELFLTGCTCGDLFRQTLMLKEAEDSVSEIAEYSKGKNVSVIIGIPVSYSSRLYNCAVVINDGRIAGLVPKTYVPAAERRWLASGTDLLTGTENNQVPYAGQSCRISRNIIFSTGDARFAVEFGDDLAAPLSPSVFHTLSGAHIIVTPASDRDICGRDEERNVMLRQHTVRTSCAEIYASANGESTQDSVYSGACSIWEAGDRLADSRTSSEDSCIIMADIDIERIEALRYRSSTYAAISPDGKESSSYRSLYTWEELMHPADNDYGKKLLRHVESHPFAPAEKIEDICRETLSIQIDALCGRLSKIGSKAVIGISGGLDSTLALIVAALAFDKLGRNGNRSQWSRKNIIGVTMPGFGTTSRTRSNAWDLMEALGITCREIPIGAAVEQHFKDIDHDPAIQDATYENSQARERTQILMDVANQVGGIVVGTGDLSELALGWATYNGDHMSMYGVNAGIPKTLVRDLVRWAARNRFAEVCTEGSRSVRDILLDIAETPISPELLPASENDEIMQVTEDLVGPYELHDFFIYNFMKYGYSPDKIFLLAGKAFCNYDDDTIRKWLNTFMRRFFNQQFKRSCMPDGPQVCEISLSPRGGWSMPSDAWSSLFTETR